MNDALSQLHLQHPFVRRILGRFLSQGYGAHDLSRVTVAQTAHDALVRVIAFGRLSLFRELWPHIRAEADARGKAATDALSKRGHDEADALRRILEAQRAAIGARQLAFDFTDAERDQRDQFEQDKRHMQERLARIDAEIEVEPPQIAELYRVVLPRLEPGGLVVLWPAVRG